jgi:amino acid transporter
MDLWHLLVGRPLKTSEAQHEEIDAPEGLAALSLDALTSVAYGPEAIVVVLAAAGAAALPLILPVTFAIVGLLALLVLSYSQVIDAYPQGGGAYTVSRENLGRGASLLAAASLIVDYTLTVAVSVAAGVAALTSAFPALLPWTVPLCLGILALITVLNLRGVGEGARAFLLPTAVFILGILAVIAVGLIHPALRPPRVLAAPPMATLAATVGALLLLKAFAAGCSALTGVEAIANGVPLFREPRVERAKHTEWSLGVLLGVMLLGLAVLTARYHIGPRSGVTVLSQVMVAAVGRSWLYYVASLATTTALTLAANTSFGGLPVLASLLARDDYLPHVFAVRGDRLVFQYGIWALAVMAAGLLILAGGNTNALIPLFAIGVFIGFTLAQSGLVVHWWRQRPPLWWARAGLNALGASATGAATLIFLWAKFREGAWIVVVAIPLLILLFRRIAAYYHWLHLRLALSQPPQTPAASPVLVVVPVAHLDRLALEALSTALSLGSEVVAVHVRFAGEPDPGLEEAWSRWNPGVRLITLQSQYHSVVRPLLRFIRSVHERAQGRVLVLIPEVSPRNWWEQVLHNQFGLILAAGLRSRADVVVGLLPYRPTGPQHT